MKISLNPLLYLCRKKRVESNERGGERQKRLGETEKEKVTDGGDDEMFEEAGEEWNVTDFTSKDHIIK